MKYKRILNFILAFFMIAQLQSISAFAEPSFSGVNEERAVVMGNAGEYNAGEYVTLLLLAGDGTDTALSNVKYIETSQVDSTGEYKFKFAYDGFEYDEQGNVNNCTLLLRIGEENINETVLSAAVNHSQLIKADITAEFGTEGASAKAIIENIFGTENLKAEIILAAYDENNKLLSTAKADKIISGENDEIFVNLNKGDTEIAKIMAFLWDTESLIPFCPKFEKSSTDNEITALSIQVGSDETEKRFVWYNSQEHYGARVQYALKSDYDADGGFTDENSTIVEGTTEIPYDNQKSVSCKVRVTGLELGKEYIYRVGDNYTFDKNVYTFKTQDNLDCVQTFNIVSDIHFGVNMSTTAAARKTKINEWNTTLQQMIDYKHPSFMISTGDNISGSIYMQSAANSLSYKEKIEYCEEEFHDLFEAPLMKTIPFASTNGNHEVKELNHVNQYSTVSGYHYDMPNEDGETGYIKDKSSGDFWFRNGDVLVVGINQFAYAYGNTATCTKELHKEFIKKAYEANTDAKWRILVNHVPAYTLVWEGILTGRNEAEILQAFFSDMIDEYDFDAVFAGHQHSYSRSYQILGGEAVDKDKLSGGRDSETGYWSEEITDPQGTVYYVVPATWTMSAFAEIKEDYAERYRTWGITSSIKQSVISAGIDSEATEMEKRCAEAVQSDSCIVYPTAAIYLNVTVDETGEKSKMTIDAVSVDKNTIVDSYTIYKSK